MYQQFFKKNELFKNYKQKLYKINKISKKTINCEFFK